MENAVSLHVYPIDLIGLKYLPNPCSNVYSGNSSVLFWWCDSRWKIGWDCLRCAMLELNPNLSSVVKFVFFPNSVSPEELVSRAGLM